MKRRLLPALVQHAASSLWTDWRSVEAAVLDGLRYVLRLDRDGALEMRDRPRDTQDAIVGARRQAEPADGSMQDCLSSDRRRRFDLLIAPPPCCNNARRHDS